MDKLRMTSTDGVQMNIDKIAALFPDCVTEALDKDGHSVRRIDRDKLLQNLADALLDEGEERYQFTWPDKRKAILLANAPINAALRPVREESVDFDNTHNLYIEGDNLDVLKLLKETYLHRVKMIYIDPPYNTGNDFVYADNFAQSAEEYRAQSGQYDEQGLRLATNTESNGRFHTDWLNMIYPRLRVARDLLTDDGVIFISIDDNEVANLKKVCDEVFGEGNFANNIVWQSTAGSNTGTDIVTVTENILVYCKNKKSITFNGKPTNEDNYPFEDEFVATRGKYALDKLDRRRVANHYSPALDYSIEMPDGTPRYPGGATTKSSEGWNYLWSKDKIEWGKRNGFIVFKQTDGWAVYCKRYSKVDNDNNPVSKTSPYRNLITSDTFNTAQGTSEMRTLFDIRVFDFPKPSNLIRHLLSMVVKDSSDSLILDFFSGSATTAHAVMQLNSEDDGHRRYICVQLPEQTAENSEAHKAGYKTICDIGKERIRRAGAKIKAESPLTTQTLDTGFRVLKLDSSNMQDVYYSPAETEQQDLFGMVDNVKADRTAEDLLFQVMLELGATLDSRIEQQQIAGKTVWRVAEGYLVACFDGDVTDEVVTAIARQQPQYAVLRDTSIRDDQTATNFEQIFRTYAPNTITKIL